MIRSKKALKRIIAVSLLSSSWLIFKQGYESNATKFTRRVSAVISSIGSRSRGYKPLSTLGSSSFSISGTDNEMSTDVQRRVDFRVYNNRIIGKNERGANIRTYSGVKLNSKQDISDRDVVLKDIKAHLERTSGETYSRTLMYELMNYEPNFSIRNDKDMTRVYKHISTDKSIQVSLQVDKLGDFTKINVTTDGRKYFFSPSELSYHLELVNSVN